MSSPEELARQNVDALLEKCGWTLQTRSTINLDAADPECDLDYVPNRSRKIDATMALCNCIAFGSKNSALVVKV